MLNLGFNRTIASYDSAFSGRLLVKREAPWGGDIYISTDQVTQSGWIVKDIWAPIINHYTTSHATWLILGVAGATVPKYIAAKKHPRSIVGIEIDPVMIEVGRRHFAIDRIPNFRIIQADAQDYIAATHDRIDYLLVDMYTRDQLPDFVYTPTFLRRLRDLAPRVIFNHLYYAPENVQAVQNFVHTLETIFPNVELVRRRLNLFLICNSTV